MDNFSKICVLIVAVFGLTIGALAISNASVSKATDTPTYCIVPVGGSAESVNFTITLDTTNPSAIVQAMQGLRSQGWEPEQTLPLAYKNDRLHEIWVEVKKKE